METAANRPVAGIIWMVVTGFCFVAVTAIVKHVGSDLPAAQSAFLRYLLGLVFFVPLLRPIISARPGARELWIFGARGVAHTVAVILWFYAMTQITIAEVTAMNYLNPVYVTIGAAFFLRESMALRRVLAVLAALLGALVILRPGFRELAPGHFAMLVAAVFFGASYLTAKFLTGIASPLVVVAMLSVTVTIGLAPFAVAVWVPPSLEQIGWMFLVAFFATAGHYTMTLAFAAAPVTVTQPAGFLQLLWSVLLGALLFGEVVDPWVVLGGSIILGSVSFITWREAVVKRHKVTPVILETKV